MWLIGLFLLFLFLYWLFSRLYDWWNRRRREIPSGYVTNEASGFLGGRSIGTAKVKVPLTHRFDRYEIVKMWRNDTAGGEWHECEDFTQIDPNEYGQPGDVIQFRIVYRNKSNRVLPDHLVVVTDTPDLEHLTFLGNGFCRINGRSCQWTLPNEIAVQFFEQGCGLSMAQAVSLVTVPHYRGGIPANGHFLVQTEARIADDLIDDGYQGELVTIPPEITAEAEARRKAEADKAKADATPAPAPAPPTPPAPVDKTDKPLVVEVESEEEKRRKAEAAAAEAEAEAKRLAPPAPVVDKPTADTPPPKPADTPKTDTPVVDAPTTPPAPADKPKTDDPTTPPAPAGKDKADDTTPPAKPAAPAKPKPAAKPAAAKPKLAVQRPPSK